MTTHPHPHDAEDGERTPLLRVDTATKRPGPLELSRSRRHAILVGIWVAGFLSALNSTMVATLVTSISSEFQRSHQSSWLGTAYLLATCTFTPLYGRLSNVLGRRGANQTAIIFSAFGTLACGLAPTMDTLIVGRFITGVGGGGVFTTMGIITSDMYSLRDRSMTQGIANIFTGLGMGLGGPIGGFISDKLVLAMSFRYDSLTSRRVGWRWAFLGQIPFWILAFMLTANIIYVTPGSSKSAKEILKRIDYGGSILLLGFVLSLLCFLSFKYQAELQWDAPRVIGSLVFAGVSFIAFVLVELYVAPAPVLAPFLLKLRIPVLVGMSNFLVAFCNFAIMYFFPMWFETVALTSATVAGLHLLPNSLAMSFGSLFAGYYLKRTGKYKTLNVICGIFPTIAAVLIARLRQDSGQLAQWLSIVTLGFGNAVVLQTTLIALLASLAPEHMPVATGFGQLWRGVGQVSGVAVSSALFQTILDSELRRRITAPGSQEIIDKIRHSSKIVRDLPPEIQGPARASYAVALQWVFTFAAISTFTAFLVRLPIPEQSIDRDETPTTTAAPTPMPASSVATPTRVQSSQSVHDEQVDYAGRVQQHLRKVKPSDAPRRPNSLTRKPRRRLSTYQSGFGGETEDESDSDSEHEHRDS
ncbi:MFS general substrate transporter [Exidia glandulosa HHB12029]|uniref:MFS general substrate transporter n=1 Tax=Exidia glandulosa HHB12029 TaxID=1314781 RepID=A0A165GJE1_EXIGL|nr:MFS general substrate transporter [Exidia glandulosa HHB12029]